MKRKLVLNVIGILILGMLSGCERETSIEKQDYKLAEDTVRLTGDFETEDGVYFWENDFLKYRDKESKKEVLVSNEPNNTKKDENNPAYIGDAFAFVNEDNLYVLKKDMPNQKIRIEKSNLDRSDIIQIYEGDGMQVFSYVRLDEWVYFFISSPVVSGNEETGVEEYNGEGKSGLMRMNLETDTVEKTSLGYEGEALEAMIIGGKDKELYCQVYSVQNGEYQSSFQKYDTGTADARPEEIFKVTGKRPAGSFVKGNKIFYSLFEDQKNIVQSYHYYDMETKETKELENGKEWEKWYEEQGM